MFDVISAEEFAGLYQDQRQQKGEIEIIDVREQEEWDDYHLAGSKLMPLSIFHKKVHELNKKQKIYVLCAHGIRSLHAAQYMIQLGFSDVVNVDGGINRVRLYL